MLNIKINDTWYGHRDHLYRALLRLRVNLSFLGDCLTSISLLDGISVFLMTPQGKEEVPLSYFIGSLTWSPNPPFAIITTLICLCILVIIHKKQQVADLFCNDHWLFSSIIWNITILLTVRFVKLRSKHKENFERNSALNLHLPNYFWGMNLACWTLFFILSGVLVLDYFTST